MARVCKQLCLYERSLIQTQLVSGWSPAAITAGLQRAHTTVIREMARNQTLTENTGLKVYFAHPYSP